MTPNIEMLVEFDMSVYKEGKKQRVILIDRFRGIVLVRICFNMCQ